MLLQCLQSSLHIHNHLPFCLIPLVPLLLFLCRCCLPQKSDPKFKKTPYIFVVKLWCYSMFIHQRECAYCIKLAHLYIIWSFLPRNSLWTSDLLICSIFNHTLPIIFSFRMQDFTNSSFALKQTQCPINFLLKVHTETYLCVLEIMPPQRSDLVLTAYIPNCETDVLVFYGLYVKTWNTQNRSE